MDWRKTTLACVALSCGLTACSTAPKPKTVPELHFVVCPANPPAIVCPPWTPVYPKHPYQMAEALLDAVSFIECVQERNAAWQDAYAACHDTY